MSTKWRTAGDVLLCRLTGASSAHRPYLEWPIWVFPLIRWRYRRQDIPMLNYFSILDPKQIVERSGSGREISFRQNKYKVALSHQAAGREIQLPSFLCYARNSIPQPSNSIPDLLSGLRIVRACNKIF